jgi:hypothetical protein
VSPPRVAAAEATRSLAEPLVLTARAENQSSSHAREDVLELEEPALELEPPAVAAGPVRYEPMARHDQRQRVGRHHPIHLSRIRLPRQTPSSP